VVYRRKELIEITRAHWQALSMAPEREIVGEVLEDTAIATKTATRAMRTQSHGVPEAFFLASVFTITVPNAGASETKHRDFWRW